MKQLMMIMLLLCFAGGAHADPWDKIVKSAEQVVKGTGDATLDLGQKVKSRASADGDEGGTRMADRLDDAQRASDSEPSLHCMMNISTDGKRYITDGCKADPTIDNLDDYEAAKSGSKDDEPGRVKRAPKGFQ